MSDPDERRLLQRWVWDVQKSASTGRFYAVDADRCPAGLSAQAYLSQAEDCALHARAARDDNEVNEGEFWEKVRKFLADKAAEVSG
jgi:hypothetical protein